MEVFIKSELNAEFQERITLAWAHSILYTSKHAGHSNLFLQFSAHCVQIRTGSWIQIQIQTNLLGHIRHNWLLIVDKSKIEKVTVKLS